MSLQETTVSTTYGDVSLPSESTGEASAPAPSPSEAGQQTQAPAPPWWEQHNDSELELQAAGKTVKAPFSKVRQWAQQGYDYAQRMQAFNQEREAFQSQQAEFGKDAEWAEVVKYARENPEWAQHTREQFEQRQNWQQQLSADPAQKPLLDKIAQLEQRLATFEPTVSEFQKEQTRIRNESQDKALDEQIKGIAERYSKVGMDLSQIDPQTGMSYERSALQFAADNGIPFKAAFYELYSDKIEAMREEALKKQFADEQGKRAKEGFIGRSPTPRGQAPAFNPAKASYNQIADYVKSQNIYGSKT